MPRIKRNIKIPDKVLNWLVSYANRSATIGEIVNNAEIDRYIDIGEYEESNYETAEWIAEEICKICGIKGVPDKKIVEIEKEYMEGQK